MPRPTHSTGAETRERILEVAQELFTTQGYDKTSLRDIAERLEITKAALYYYFARKEDILLELHLGLHHRGSEMLDEIERVPDGPERVAAWPKMMRRFIEDVANDRTLLLMHQRNAGAIEALHNDPRNMLENDEMEARLSRILSSTVIPIEQRVRMSAAVGVITETLVDSRHFDDVVPEQLVSICLQIIDEMLGVSASRPETT